MSIFLSKLSQNYLELLEDDEYYDVTVEVGEDPNVKIFRAHMNILCYRSPYLRRTLASKKKSNDNDLAHINLRNISPENFQIILRYIYGGAFSLNGQDTLEIFKTLVAAEKLLLQELIDYLQKHFIENESEWMEKHFDLIHRTCFQSNCLIELQQFCTDFMAKSPEKIFKSFDFTSLLEKSLVLLITRDDLQMKEIEVWEHVLKWGLAQNPTLIPDPNTWSDNDFKNMENTLQHCLPLIRFFSLSSKEFLQKVRPYKKLLKQQLYEDLLSSHLDPDSEPSNNISLPRTPKIDNIIDSIIVNSNIVSIISRWIDKVDNNKFVHLRELYLPYKFQLLLRGSRDGFTPNIFHTLCDDKPITVTFIKVKGTEEILGGYNPSIWKSSERRTISQEPFERRSSFDLYSSPASFIANSFIMLDIPKYHYKTKDSFIFSFKNKNNFKDAIIYSNVKNIDNALSHNNSYGPCFGNDIIIHASDEYTNFDTIYCNQNDYEKKIRDTESGFSIEDYEIFQII